MKTSFPKNKIKVLLLENIHVDAVKNFEKEEFSVELIKGALDENELMEKLQDVHILGIRSKTQLTQKAIENAPKLLAVGAFCIGTNQIDLTACQNNGVAVFNAPYSNTRSVVELAISEIIFLFRNLGDKNRDMHNGKWTKSAVNSFEVRQRSIGIVGYGKIGSQLSVVAEAIGMKVYYWDLMDKMPLGNATQCTTLEELLPLVDVVTLHIDGRPENDGFFTSKYFNLMKEGSYFLNLARGKVVDVNALAECIVSGKLKGAGVDVFPEEPKTNIEPFYSELQNLPNVLLTPHIGGSTQEAQVRIAQYVPDKLIQFINNGNTFDSVNFPNLQLPKLENAHRLMHLHENKFGVIAKINQILAEHKCNVLGQYLKTVDNIGYVITDVQKEYSQELIGKLRGIEETIRFRILY